MSTRWTRAWWSSAPAGYNDSWKITPVSGGILISGTPVHAGDLCKMVKGNTLGEVSPAPLGYILAWGADGNGFDQLFRAHFGRHRGVRRRRRGLGCPQRLQQRRHPRPGRPDRIGSTAAAGRTPSLARSRPGQAGGGPGSDNLATDNPCGGHYFSGGSGSGDVAGSQRLGGGGVRARDRRARATRPARQGNDDTPPTTRSSEGTESSPSALYARRRSDLLISATGTGWLCVGGEAQRAAELIQRDEYPGRRRLELGAGAGSCASARRWTRTAGGAAEAGRNRHGLTADVYVRGEADRRRRPRPRRGCRAAPTARRRGRPRLLRRRAGRAARGFPRFTDPRLRGPASTAAYLRRATERSLERVGADSFDLLLLHNPDRIGYESEAVWDAMAALRDGPDGVDGVAPRPGERLHPGPDLVLRALRRAGDRLGDGDPQPSGAMARRALPGGRRAGRGPGDYGVVHTAASSGTTSFPGPS